MSDLILKQYFHFAIDVVNKKLGWGDTVFIKALSGEQAIKEAVTYLETKSLKFDTDTKDWEMVDIRQIPEGTYRRRKRRTFGTRKQRIKKEEEPQIIKMGLLDYDVRELQFLTGILKKKLGIKR